MTHPLTAAGSTMTSVSLPSRAALHPARKVRIHFVIYHVQPSLTIQLFHFLTGFVFAMCNRNLPAIVWRPLAALLFLFAFSTEVARIRQPGGRVNKLVMRAFRPFMRSHETHQFSGTGYYMFGVAVVSLLFSTTSACIGILCLASLDPIAALMGTTFHPYLPQARLRNGKSFAGFLFSATTAVLITTLMLNQADVSTLTSSDMEMVGFFVGVAGAMTELAVPTPRYLIGEPSFPLGIDDNALIPIVCALVCEVMLQITDQTTELSPLLLWDARYGSRHLTSSD